MLHVVHNDDDVATSLNCSGVDLAVLLAGEDVVAEQQGGGVDLAGLHVLGMSQGKISRSWMTFFIKLCS